jgi:F0F1-type ATP synthase membrane subunit b/b'
VSFYETVAVVSQTLSALVFAAILVWVWFKYVMPAIRAAQEAENGRIAEAQRHLEESRAAIGLLKTEIEGAKRDAASIRLRAGEQGEHERIALLAETREAGERSLAGADGELDRALFSARERLRADLLQKALRMARSEASDRIDARMNAKLVDNFVTTLERENG